MIGELALTKKTDEISMNEYLTKKQSLILKLKSTNVPFNEGARIGFIFGGLPKQYENLMLSFSSKEDKTSLEEVISKLYLTETLDKIHRDFENSGEEKALSLRSQPRYRKDSNCYLKYNGNFQNQNKGINGNQNIKKNVMCFSCNQAVHISNFCPEFNVPKNGGIAKIAEVQKESEEEEEIAVVAVEPMETTEEFVFTAHAGNKSKELKDLWILDLGASHHMTPYKDIFDNLNEGVRGNVIMAKKTSTPLLGKGSVALKVTNEYGGRKLRLTNCSYVLGLDCNLLSIRQLDRLGCEAHKKWVKRTGQYHGKQESALRHNG
jgi:hypothetical protein